MKDLNPGVEWQRYIQDIQWGPGDNYAFIPSDLIALEACKDALENTPVADGPRDYDVRATYDSRLINSYDFNFAQLNLAVLFDEIWTIGFQVPFGYRAVVRKFKITYDNDVGGPIGNSWVVPLANTTPPGNTDIVTQSLWGGLNQFFIANSVGAGSAVPNTTQIPIGPDGEVDCFFVVEEGTWFGMLGENANLVQVGSPTMSINIYGNLIPSENMQLPFAIGNPIRGMQ